MSAADGFRRKELWSMDGKDFMIQVSRHEEPVHFPSGCYDETGPHRWCVYAYIYPKHPHFAAFDGTENMWQDATAGLPLHGGVTYCRKHVDASGTVTSYQVGADYNHLYDSYFTRCDTPDEASEVFNDARQLHKLLTTIKQATLIFEATGGAA